MNDVKFAVRQLLKHPGFGVLAVLTLGLGIGASTAIYSVVDTVILNPVPGRDANRLVQIGERDHGNKDEPRFGGVTTGVLERLQQNRDLFSEVVWLESLSLERKSEDGFIEEIGGSMVSPNFFKPWDVKPLLGRTFAAGEAARITGFYNLDRDTVMVLSYSLWQARFGGNENVIGKTIDANGRRFTIIGVMPPHFRYPWAGFWVPVENSTPGEEAANIRAFVRLKPGVTLAQTQAMLDTVARQLLTDHPEIYVTDWRRRGGGFALLARPLRDDFTATPYGAADLHRTLWGLLAAIGFVLLIACVNIANLMLARTESRQREMCVRSAVGASRARLLRQLLTESVLLASCATVAGLAVTFWGMKVLTWLIPAHIPRVRPIEIEGHTLAFTLLIGVGTALVCGLAPALQASRVSLSASLGQAGANATVSRAWRRYRGALVISQVAVTLVLLIGAALMVDSVIRLLRANPGFDPEKLLLVHPGLLRGEKYAWSERAAEVHGQLFDQFQNAFKSLPGVEAVGIGKLSFFRLGFTIEGMSKPIGLLAAGTGVGESDIFRAMRIPLLAGRYFDRTDIGKETGTVIINQMMARLCWPGDNALNKRFRDKGGSLYHVIGIVGDAHIGLRNRTVDAIEPTFYRPYYEDAASGGFGPFFVVRTRQEPQTLIPAIQEMIKSVEPSMTTPWFQVARHTLYNATELQRVYTLYLVGFGLVGLFLGLLGIYGVLTYSVSRRTRELGIRIALGAGRRQVIGLVLGEGARLVTTGMGLGILAAFCLTRLLRSQLFGVTPTDPGAFGAAMLCLMSAALVACWLPARGAARINPIEALRYE